MATIGSFTKTGDGFTGSVKTLTLNVKAQFRPSEKDSDKAPDFRILAGSTEFGAAWKKTSREGREYPRRAYAAPVPRHRVLTGLEVAWAAPTLSPWPRAWTPPSSAQPARPGD